MNRRHNKRLYFSVMHTCIYVPGVVLCVMLDELEVCFCGFLYRLLI